MTVLTNTQMQAVVNAGGSVLWPPDTSGTFITTTGALPSDNAIATYFATHPALAAALSATPLVAGQLSFPDSLGHLVGSLGLSWDDTLKALSIFGARGAGGKLQVFEESLTLATGGLVTDSTANLLPANSLILAVSGLVTTALTTTTSWALGDPVTAARFAAANASLGIGASSIGYAQWSGAITTLAAGPSQPAAAKVRVTCAGANPGAGVIDLAVLAFVFNAPTS